MKKNRIRKWLAIALAFAITSTVKSFIGNSAEVVFDNLFSSIRPEWIAFVMYCVSDIGLEFFSLYKRN